MVAAVERRASIRSPKRSCVSARPTERALTHAPRSSTFVASPARRVGDGRRAQGRRRHAGRFSSESGIDTSPLRSRHVRRGRRRRERSCSPRSTARLARPRRHRRHLRPKPRTCVASLKRGPARRDAERRSPGHRRSHRAQAGIDEVIAEVLPDGKVDAISRCSKAGTRRDGRRRPQRRAGARAGRRRHRDGIREPTSPPRPHRSR